MFNVHRFANRLSIALSSTMVNIDRTAEETAAFLSSHGRQAQIFSVGLGMREGMTNAVKHAHHYDKTKIIRYTIEILTDRLIVVIEDEGEGFNWHRVQATEPVLDAEHGRGLWIIGQSSSYYTFNAKGNRLTFGIVWPGNDHRQKQST